MRGIYYCTFSSAAKSWAMNPTRSGEILQNPKTPQSKDRTPYSLFDHSECSQRAHAMCKGNTTFKRKRNQILSASPNSLWAHAEISAREMLLLFSRSSAKSYRSTHFSFSDHMGGTDDCPSALHRRDSWHPAYLRSSVRWEHSQAHCSVELVECSVAWLVHHDVHAGTLRYC